MPILAVVGLSGSGKTTLIERIIPLLAGAGCRVATIKHDVHHIDIDTPGKDSFRHREAGACKVALVSSEMLFLTEKLTAPPTLDDLRRRFLNDGVDLILAEGFKQSGEDKIEVNRRDRSASLISSPDDPTLKAVVTDQLLALPVPTFHLDDLAPISAFILSWLANKRENE